MKTDQERVRNIIHNTIVSLCEHGLNFDKHLRIEGVIGITTDSHDVFIIHINQLLTPTSGAAHDQASQLAPRCVAGQTGKSARPVVHQTGGKVNSHSMSQQSYASAPTGEVHGRPRLKPSASLTRQSPGTGAVKATSRSKSQQVGSQQMTNRKTMRNTMPSMPQLERYSPASPSPVRNTNKFVTTPLQQCFYTSVQNQIAKSSNQFSLQWRESRACESPGLQQLPDCKSPFPKKGSCEVILLDDDDPVPETLQSSTAVENRSQEWTATQSDISGFEQQFVSSGLDLQPESQRSLSKSEIQNEFVPYEPAYCNEQLQSEGGTLLQVGEIVKFSTGENSGGAALEVGAHCDSYLEEYLTQGDSGLQAVLAPEPLNQLQEQAPIWNSGDAQLPMPSFSNPELLSDSVVEVKTSEPFELVNENKQGWQMEGSNFPPGAGGDVGPASCAVDDSNQGEPSSSKASLDSCMMAASKCGLFSERNFEADDYVSEEEDLLFSDTSEEWNMDDEDLSDPDWSDETLLKKKSKIAARKRSLPPDSSSCKKKIARQQGKPRPVAHHSAMLPHSTIQVDEGRSWKLVARYACTVAGCSASFSKKYNLVRHQKLKHCANSARFLAYGSQNQGIE